MRQLLFTVIALVAIGANAIAQSSTTEFFFGYKKSSLTQEHKTKLGELVEDLDAANTQVKVIAYCDSVGGPAYNVKLGKARADLFVKFFASKEVSEDKISVVNNGSDNPPSSNETEEGREQNRKVVVEIYGSGEAAENDDDDDDDDKEEEMAKAPEACSQDTIIMLNDGALMKVNKCEYKKIRDCLTINTYASPEDLKDAKFTTMTKEGAVLSTAGIIDIRMCDDVTTEHPITVYIPIDERCKPSGTPDLWTSYQNDVWNSRNKKAQIDTVEGNLFYSYTTSNSGTANFGTEIEDAPEFQVKGKKGLKLKSVTAYYSCEMGVYKKELEKPSKKIKINLPCPSRIIYFDVVGEKKGEEVKFTYVPSSDLKIKCKQKGCDNKDIKRKFYFYPPAK